MAGSKKIIIPGIGEVLFEKSHRAKYVNISVRPVQGIRVAVPVGVPIATAKKIAEGKSHWIHKHIFDNKKIEKECYRIIKKPIDINEAKKKISDRIIKLSRKYDIPFNKVFVKNQKTLWGSCSAKKNINLNINIIRLPKELMDYVILHELVHIRCRRHDKKYWQELEKIIPNARKLDRELDDYRPLLFFS